MPESKTQSNLLFYCTLVLTHLYRDTLGLIQGEGGGGGRGWKIVRTEEGKVPTTAGTPILQSDGPYYNCPENSDHLMYSWQILNVLEGFGAVLLDGCSYGALL